MASPAKSLPAPASSSSSSSSDPDLAELGHCVVTSHPPGAVQCSVKCSFLSDESTDVIVAKSNLLEVRRLASAEDASGAGEGGASEGGRHDDPFPAVLTLPINGRIMELAPIRFPTAKRDCLFFLTERGGYALIAYDESLADANDAGGTSGKSSSSDMSASPPTPTGEHYPIQTLASGTLKSYTDSVLAGGRQSECGPLLAVDHLHRCLALHVYDGYLTILPINRGYDMNSFKRVPWRRNAPFGTGAKGTIPSVAAGVPRKSDALSLAGGSGKPSPQPRGVSKGPFGEAFHLRIEERTVLSLAFLQPSGERSGYVPQLAVMHQDARGFQHVRSHGVDLGKKALIPNGHLTAVNPHASSSARRRKSDTLEGEGKPAASLMPPPGEQLKISKIEGGSGCIVPVPPPGRASGHAEGGAANGGGSAKHLGGVLSRWSSLRFAGCFGS